MGPKLATYMELIDMLMELIDMLGWCSIIYGEDISDGYHVSVCGGCTMSLVWGWGVTGVEEVWVDVESADSGRAAEQRFVWGWLLHVGCWPGDCLLTCDKEASAFSLDGALMRWSVAHFGQKCAGSPLNVLAMCALRFLARMGCLAPGRGGNYTRSGMGG